MKQHSRNLGFTLIEVIVSLSLLSLILTIGIMSFRGLSQTANALDQRLEEQENLRILASFLRQNLTNAVTLPKFDAFGQSMVQFVGHNDDLRWIGPLAARHGIGGLSQFRLRMTTNDTNRHVQDVFIDISNYRENRSDELIQGSTHQILSHVSNLTFSFKGLGDDTWTDRWNETDVIPSHVKLTFEMNGVPSPMLVFRLENAEPSAQLRYLEPPSLSRVPLF